jgi:hypothetical protein
MRKLTVIIIADDEDAVLDTVVSIGESSMWGPAADPGDGSGYDESGDGAKVSWIWETI